MPVKQNGEEKMFFIGFFSSYDSPGLSIGRVPGGLGTKYGGLVRCIMQVNLSLAGYEKISPDTKTMVLYPEKSGLYRAISPKLQKFLLEQKKCNKTPKNLPWDSKNVTQPRKQIKYLKISARPWKIGSDLEKFRRIQKKVG